MRTEVLVQVDNRLMVHPTGKLNVCHTCAFLSIEMAYLGLYWRLYYHLQLQMLILHAEPQPSWTAVFFLAACAASYSHARAC
jgi:hypothetical protein